MTKKEIAKIIDHTNLKANATPEEIRKTCREAKGCGFRSVCLNPRWVKLAKEELKDTGVRIAVVIDWPVGASSTEARVFTAKVAEEDGADELDLVMDIGSFKAGNYDEVLKDFREVAKVLPTKVIIETGFLTEEEIKKASELVKESGAFCVKTSTGADPKVDIPTKVLHLKLIRETVGLDFSIKAAGGIKTLEDAQKIIRAGANIIGTSNGMEIMEGESS